jgi:hypothetical protein
MVMRRERRVKKMMRLSCMNNTGLDDRRQSSRIRRLEYPEDSFQYGRYSIVDFIVHCFYKKKS